MADDSTANARDTGAGPSPRAGEYVVIARRYRPGTFDALIGQEHVARGLSNAIATGRVGHAYLFTGARGVGKTSAARILAKALNCVEGPTPTPCNECDVCQSISRGDDVDVLEIDGASNRGIDEIRQLRQNAGVRPSRARFKIYIIDEVHMLTKEAFNALLKTLEEPPEHVKFIFATTEPNKIPITILSRCQRFDFAGIDAVAIENRLRQIAENEGVAVEREALQILARRAGGSMRDSQSLLEQLLSIGSREITADDVNSLLGTAPAARLSELVRLLADRDAGGALRELSATLNQGVEVGQLLDQLLGYYRDVLSAAVGCTSDLYLNVTPSQFPEVAELSKKLGVETLLAIVQILEQAASRLRVSMHGRTLAEMALVRVAKLADLDSIASLIEAVESGTPLPESSRPGAIHGGSPSAVAVPSQSSVASQAPSPSRSTPEPPAPKKNGSPEPEPVTPSAAPAANSSVPFFGPLTEQSAQQVWRHLLDSVTDLVSVQADKCERVSISGPHRLAVWFRAKYNSCKQFCELPDQKAKLEQGLIAATGEHVRIDFALVDDEADTGEAARVAPAVSRRQQQADVLKRPLVKRAMELFGVEQPRVEIPDNG